MSEFVLVRTGEEMRITDDPVTISADVGGTLYELNVYSVGATICVKFCVTKNADELTARQVLRVDSVPDGNVEVTVSPIVF